MVLRDLFINLSENEFLNENVQKYGMKLGAQHIVAGTNIPEMIESVKQLNNKGISTTIDYLGEFVFEESTAIEAKEMILQVIESIHTEQLNAHISLKPSQLGLDIDMDFAYDNLREIVEKANEYNIFVNIDMENYENAQGSVSVPKKDAKKYFIKI